MEFPIVYYMLEGIDNDPNTIYIGQTVRDIQTRLDEHKYIHNRVWETTHIIDQSVSNEKESLNIENGWMDYYRALGWNVVSKKMNMKIHKHSDEYIAMMSEINTGENNPMYGKTHSINTRKLIGERSKGRQTMKGKKHSDETKQLQREIALNRPKEKCMWCPMETTKTNIIRHHNDNCPHKPRT